MRESGSCLVVRFSDVGVGGTDSASSYWCTNRLEVKSRAKLVLGLPFDVLVSRDNKVVVLLELSTLLDVTGVAGHGC
jgi:hypothetical protein